VENNLYDSEDSERDGTTVDDKRKKIHLIYGHRRRQRNSDSDTSSCDSNNDNYAYTKCKMHDKKKLFETQYLSEDELDDFDDDTVLSKSDASSVLSSSSSQSGTVETKTDAKEEKLSNFITNLITSHENDAEPLKLSNFKEFSTNLFENYSMYESKFGISGLLTSTQFNENNEFIDDESYKSILNGQKQVSIPPGFERNEKESREIEELGKKLATFQIETDTEMSQFNSDTNLNTSSSDDGDDDPTRAADNQSSNQKQINLQV
jgi:hypothetical protein